MPRYNPNYLPHFHTHDLDVTLNQEPLPVEFHEFYKAYGHPTHAILIEESINGEPVNYEHINKCGMVGTADDDNLRMVLWRSTHRLDTNDLQSGNIHDLLLVFDPVTGIDRHEVVGVTRIFESQQLHATSRHTVTLETKDAHTSRPKWLQIPTTGDSVWVEGGAYFPIRTVTP